jgi:hypothetical protein
MMKSACVTIVATWLFAGATYSIHRGLAGAIQGWTVISALGPNRAYRSVILAADTANHVLQDVLATADPGARADTVESLLRLCGSTIA